MWSNVLDNFQVRTVSEVKERECAREGCEVVEVLSVCHANPYKIVFFFCETLYVIVNLFKL